MTFSEDQGWSGWEKSIGRESISSIPTNINLLLWWSACKCLHASCCCCLFNISGNHCSIQASDQHTYIVLRSYVKIACPFSSPALSNIWVSMESDAGQLSFPVSVSFFITLSQLEAKGLTWDPRVYRIFSIRCHGCYFFAACFYAATIQAWLLFKGGVYFRLQNPPTSTTAG